MKRAVNTFAFIPIQLGLVILFSFSFSVEVYCQSIDNIVPPPPNSYSFVKYIDHPVSHNTGVPEVSIPLFSWGNASDLSLNLALSYHLGGIKVEELASNVGLGWSLQGLGVITRSMRGRPDDAVIGFINTPDLPDYNTFGYDGAYTNRGVYYDKNYLLNGLNGSNYNELYMLYNNYQDAQQDIFYLSVAGISLKFFIGKDKSILFEEYSNIIVTPIYSTYGPIVKFEVIDDKGIKYTFEEIEITRSSDFLSTFIAVPYFTSSWLLTKIEDPNNQAAIKISYSNYNQSYSGNFYEITKLREHRLEHISVGSEEYTIRNFQYIGVSGRRVSLISLPDGSSISFLYDSQIRTDTGDNRLKQIDFRIGSEQLYSYEFAHSYFTGSGSPEYSYRLKLDELKKTKGKISEVYKFEYVSNTMIPRYSTKQDFWGYAVTDARLMPKLAPKIEVFSSWDFKRRILNGVDRSTDPIGVLSGSLKKITYPTKGYTVFNMEANQAYDTNDFFLEKKDYLMAFDQSDSNETLSLDIELSKFQIDSLHFTLRLKETYRDVNPGGGINWLEDMLDKTRIQVRIRNENNTWSKTIYSEAYSTLKHVQPLEVFNQTVPSPGLYKLEISIGNFNPYPIKLEGSLELRVIGKNHISRYIGGLRAKNIQHYSADDQLLLEKSYKYLLANGESSGRIGNVPNYDYYRYSSYFYTLVDLGDKDRPLLEVPRYMGTERWLIRNSMPTIDLAYILNTPVLYTYIEEKTIGINAEDNGSVVYEFYPFKYFGGGIIFPFSPGVIDVWTSGKPKKISYLNSIGSLVMTKEFQYEHNLTYEGYSSKHRSLKLGVIAHHNLEDITPSSETQYVALPMYPSLGFSRLKKETTTMHWASGNTQEIIDYTYDAKKQLKQAKQVNSDGKLSTVYTYYPYDYSHLATYQALTQANRIGAYVQRDVVTGSVTSPEARMREFKNFKNYASIPRYEGTYLNYTTGTSAANVNPATLGTSYKAAAKVVSYDVYGNPLEVQDANGLSSVYLWGYAGQYLVAEIANATHAEVATALVASGWVASTVFNNLNQANVTDANINTYAQGIRNKLPKAQTTSFTHKPLVGITSITDARGLTEYYQYDGFGRLSSVLDHTKNIIKAYCYNYSGQQVDCL